MKKLSILFFLLILSSGIQAQKKTLISDYQSYTRGTANAKFKDSCQVIITYDFDERKADFEYKSTKEPKYSDIISVSIALAFVDKESNAPAVYAETLDKHIASLIFYDDRIEINYRNGNQSIFSGLHAPAASPTKTKTK
jgi:hypothetical protein